MSENDRKYILEVKDLTKRFSGVVALKDINISIKPGTVHALMGENGAGKSTLMNCLYGLFKPDEGEIILDGEYLELSSPSEAINSKIAMVHQELNQVLSRSVMENVWLGRFPLKNGLIDYDTMYDETKEIFDGLGLEIDPRSLTGDLSVSNRQMVEIAKAVSHNFKILMLDEPTSSLAEHEVETLFRVIRSLSKQGVGIIYVSHKIDEVKEISHYITILRDGHVVETGKTSDFTVDQIITKMVGRELTERYPERKNYVQDNIMMEVKDLENSLTGLKDINFTLRKGEVMGISGLVGAKKTELLETIFGLRSLDNGKIFLKGKEVSIDSPKQAVQDGFALVTEERRRNGIFKDLSVSFNMIISNLTSFLQNGLLNNSKIKPVVAEYIERISIKTPSDKTPIGNLSGGNQQKVIFSRWLISDPEILLLDEPTRGIDVGAKYEIYKLINQLVSMGKSVIIVSSEMPELLGMSDRILVLSNGRQAGIFDANGTNQVELMSAATKYL